MTMNKFNVTNVSINQIKNDLVPYLRCGGSGHVYFDVVPKYKQSCSYVLAIYFFTYSKAMA